MQVEDIKDEDLPKPSTSGSVLLPSASKYNHIKNKDVRNQKFHKLKKEAKKVK